MNEPSQYCILKSFEVTLFSEWIHHQLDIELNLFVSFGFQGIACFLLFNYLLNMQNIYTVPKGTYITRYS